MAKKQVAKLDYIPHRLVISLAALSLVPAVLLAVRIAASSSMRYIFLLWNLVLAVIPVILAVWLVRRIQLYGWFKWQQIVITVAWALFLPNSFYIVTDLIHLRPNYEASLLFDISLLMSFISVGLVFGFLSVFLVHRELSKRLSSLRAYGLVGLLFLAVSFAIYLGRYTRWNTWDILLRPAGLLFDVSDRFINPAIHTQTYQTTFVLFLLLFSLYGVIWESSRLLERK